MLAIIKNPAINSHLALVLNDERIELLFFTLVENLCKRSVVLVVVNQMVVINQPYMVSPINFNIKSISCNDVNQEWNLH